MKGKGHYLDEPLFTISEWSAPSIHDLAGWIETGLIFIAILLLARMAKGGMFLSTLSDEPNRWLNLRSASNPIFSMLTIILISGAAYWTEFTIEALKMAWHFAKIRNQPGRPHDFNYRAGYFTPSCRTITLRRSQFHPMAGPFS